jgi:hypothetical protein
MHWYTKRLMRKGVTMAGIWFVAMSLAGIAMMLLVTRYPQFASMLGMQFMVMSVLYYLTEFPKSDRIGKLAILILWGFFVYIFHSLAVSWNNPVYISFAAAYDRWVECTLFFAAIYGIWTIVYLILAYRCGEK